jgi:predicted small secreted protein
MGVGLRTETPCSSTRLLVFEKIMMIKITLLFLALVGLSLSGCGTVGGALSGAGSDLTSAGNWVKEIGQ